MYTIFLNEFDNIRINCQQNVCRQTTDILTVIMRLYLLTKYRAQLLQEVELAGLRLRRRRRATWRRRWHRCVDVATKKRSERVHRLLTSSRLHLTSASRLRGWRCGVRIGVNWSMKTNTKMYIMYM